MNLLQAPKQALYSAPDKPIFYTDDSMISAKLLSKSDLFYVSPYP